MPMPSYAIITCPLCTNTSTIHNNYLFSLCQCQQCILLTTLDTALIGPLCTSTSPSLNLSVLSTPFPAQRLPRVLLFFFFFSAQPHMSCYLHYSRYSHPQSLLVASVIFQRVWYTHKKRYFLAVSSLFPHWYSLTVINQPCIANKFP
jgi:hypothetical protein